MTFGGGHVPLDQLDAALQELFEQLGVSLTKFKEVAK